MPTHSSGQRAAWLISRRLAQILALAIAASLAIGVVASGFGRGFEEQLRLMRDDVRNRPATGQVHLVEIDARSLKTLGVWPWPRSRHGELLDRLRLAGAATVAFDVDFSAPSPDALQDAAFAKALARFGGSAILPTFRQSESGASATMQDNLPIPPLRDQAFLASVNVQADGDGQLRHYSYGTVTEQTPRPSIAALLAGTASGVERSFRIDGAIDPATLPRHSYADLLTGKDDGRDLAGKSVLIGATAIEMGDRYSMPGHGILPGMVIQALAAETLIQGTQNPDLGPWPLFFVGLMFAILLGRARRKRTRTAILIIGGSTLLGLPMLTEAMLIGSLQPAAGLSLFMAAATGYLVIDIFRRFRAKMLMDQDSMLPNARALAARNQIDSPVIIAVRIRAYDRIVGVLDAKARDDLVSRIVSRLELGAGTGNVHWLQSGIFGWLVTARNVDELNDLADSIAALFRNPVQADGRSVLITPTIGMAQAHGHDIDLAIGQAIAVSGDAEGQDLRWMLHNDQISSAAERAITLLADIDIAMKTGAILVHYQPKLRIADDRITTAEALVRWQHPVLGLIMPDHFIPLLEKNKRMGDLTLHILDQVCERLVTAHNDGLEIGIAVNISAPLFDAPDFVSALTKRVALLGPLSNRLTLEITETASIGDASNAVSVLEQLQALGARTSIDDYGTGQSTLKYLRTFPVNEIKVDKSFITNLLTSPGDQILVRSTIDLAHDLGVAVVAEGVENAESLAMLAEFGCDYAQGWHIEKAVAFDDFARLVQRSSSDAPHTVAVTHSVRQSAG